MSEKIETCPTKILLSAVAFKLEKESSSKSVLLSRPVMEFAIPKPKSDEEWVDMKNTIAAMSADAKPNAASVLFTLVHNVLRDLWLKPDFHWNSWPCASTYTIERDRHIYKFGNVSLGVSILEEGCQLIPLFEQEEEQNPIVDPQPQFSTDALQVPTDAQQSQQKGEYFYILIELKNDPSACGYTVSQFLREKVPLFTKESETVDRARMRYIRKLVSADIKKFEGCVMGKKFRSKEYSQYGVKPVKLPIFFSSGKRKMGTDSNSPVSDAQEAEAPTRLSIAREELEADFDKFQNHKPTEPSKLAATLLVIMRSFLKCSVTNFNTGWLVPPIYTSQVVTFKIPNEKPIPMESGYDSFTMTILNNKSDYFVVFRVAPVPSKYVVQKITSCLVPKLFADDTEEDGIAISENMKWYNLEQWLCGVDDNFFSKLSVGFFTPSSNERSLSSGNPSSNERSLSSGNQSPAAR